MTAVEVANLGEFQFDASAPEFVPWPTLPAEQPWVEPKAPDRPRHSRTYSSASVCGSEALEGSTSITEDGDGASRRQAQGLGLARRSTSAAEAPGQVATLVVKNLALDLEKDTVLQYLQERGVAPLAVELHRDAIGAFRGTAFVRYQAPDEAMAALEKLGSSAEFGGRKARIEIQKSKTLIGRRSLEAEVPDEELGRVRWEIEQFLQDGSAEEMRLPANFNVQQRKYAHSIAERHSLKHVTSQGENGEKHVLLSKARRSLQPQEAISGRPRANTTGAPVGFGLSAAMSPALSYVGSTTTRRSRKARAQNQEFQAEFPWMSPSSDPPMSPGLWMSPDFCWMPPGLDPGGMLLPPPGLAWNGSWQGAAFEKEAFAKASGAEAAEAEDACHGLMATGADAEGSTDATEDDQPSSDSATGSSKARSMAPPGLDGLSQAGDASLAGLLAPQYRAASGVLSVLQSSPLGRCSCWGGKRATSRS